MDKTKIILREAKKLAESTKTWADFSNALFDPLDGLVAHMFKDPIERANFRKTTVYNKLHELVENKMQATGLIAGATPKKKSGKFVVRLPRSLHAALEKEAEAEDTSLNQLIVTKLAVQLDNIAGGRLARIIQAFAETRNGYSVDRVIADPKKNKMYLKRCRELGLSGTDFDINWELMSARKAGKLSHLPKTKRYTVQELDEYEYASEIAVRYLQLEKEVSLDQIICDPDLAEEFDQYAFRLSPGFSPLQYRWAALGLRKAGRLGSMKKQYEKLPTLESIGHVSSLRLKEIPEIGGLYMFTANRKHVFLGQTDNLRHRLERHMEISSSRGLPDWLWDTRKFPLSLEVASLPNITKSSRQAMELLLVKKWNPVLNFPRKVA